MENGCHNKGMVALLFGTVTAIGTAGAIWMAFKKKSKKYHEFVEAGRVDELNIFPIKSAKGNRVEWLDCEQPGCRYGEEKDRQFIVVDALHDNAFMTARVFSKLVLVEAHVQDNQLSVKLPGDADSHEDRRVLVDLDEVKRGNDVRSAKMHYNEHMDGMDCGDEISQALAKYLDVQGKRQPRLLWRASENMHSEREEPAKREHWVNFALSLDDKIHYHDRSSLMVVNRSSLDDLNRHLLDAGHPKIDSRNFRPNLVISGLPPFDEDYWLRVRIGGHDGAEFAFYTPCNRCILTTVDPDLGAKNEQMEPLRSLRKYRLAPQVLVESSKDSPIFGLNMSVVKPGRVRVGDPVWIQYKQNAH